MDVRVEATAATAHAEMGEVTTVISILAVPAVARLLPLVVASTRIPSVGDSSVSAVPNPVRLGGMLANAA